MKKSMYLAACLLMALALPAYTVKADTLSALLNDLENDITVSEKTGVCKGNPYLSSKGNVACKAIIAQCPKGMKLIPGVSKCSIVPNATDAALADVLKQVKPWDANLDRSEYFKTKRLGETGLSCNADAGYIPAGGSGIGYSPFCFFDLSKVETIPAGAVRFAKPEYTDGNLVYLSNGSTITQNELHNANNYKCYSMNFKVTARCITPPPTSLLDKLGIKHK